VNLTFADGIAGLEAVFVGTHRRVRGRPGDRRRCAAPYPVVYDVAGGAIVALRGYFPITR
jgi:hypothetical protein